MQEMMFFNFYSSSFFSYNETPFDLAIKNKQYEAAQIIDPSYTIQVDADIPQII